jgi:ubiquinol-cytochrome c reductase cytochrome c1 subunit
MKNIIKHLTSKTFTATLLIMASMLMFSQSLLAAGGGAELMTANVDVSDKASLQRGAKLFTDYCLSCHSAKFVRFNRVAEDLDLTEKQVMENLNHLGVKFGSTMSSSMTKEYAKKTFGAVPPDLSLVGRSRGEDWLFSYLLSFYQDTSKPTGFNNLIFKDVGMPNVLWELQGTQKATFDEHGKLVKMDLNQGQQSAAEFESSVRDLVAFLSYIGEPRQLERKQLGIWVLIFLSLLFVVAYAMKKEYWKDVH